MQKTQNLTPLVLLMLVYVLPGYANEQAFRYRGEYTYGHEVNTFCPENNSQCYWLNPTTTAQIRQQLWQISDKYTDKPYQSICVVLQGDIDREAKRIGFAADYDGLIDVYKVFGLCQNTDIVTQGDLQHHRWVLTSINNAKIDLSKQSNNPSYPDFRGNMARTDSNILYLEFGEQMTVLANIGCNIFTGRAVLREDYIIINISDSNTWSCSAKDKTVNSSLKNVLSSEPKITIDSENNLLLQSDSTVLKYQLKDWVN